MNWKTALLGFCVAASVCGAYERRITPSIERLRTLKEVGSDHVGYAGTADRFYLLYAYLCRVSTNADVLEMLRDPSPAVRIMGAKCVLGTPSRKIDRAVLQTLLGDPVKIPVGPGGCVYRIMTVGDVVDAIERNRNFLGPADPPHTAPSLTSDWTAWIDER